MWVAGFGNSLCSLTSSLVVFHETANLSNNTEPVFMNKTSVCTVRPKTDRGTSRTSNTNRRVNMKPRHDLPNSFIVFQSFPAVALVPQNRLYLTQRRDFTGSKKHNTKWTVLTGTTNCSCFEKDPESILCFSGSLYKESHDQSHSFTHLIGDLETEQNTLS